jgi:GNAT superfamily N-acetyltransferase
MDFKTFLNESPYWDDSNKNLSKLSDLTREKDELRYQNVQRHGSLVSSKQFGDYTLELWKNKNNRALFALKDGQIVGFLGAVRLEYFRFPKVISVYVYDEYQGKGIGKAMYDFMIDTVGGLVSDKSLTGEEGKGSFQMWQKLAKDYNPYFLRWKDNRYQTIPVKEFNREMMTSSDENFMVSKKPVPSDN